MKEERLFFSDTNIDVAHTVDALIERCILIVNDEDTIDLKELYRKIQNEYIYSKINYSSFRRIIIEEFRMRKDIVYSIKAIEKEDYNVFFSKTKTSILYSYKNLLDTCIAFINNKKTTGLSDLSEHVEKTFFCDINKYAFKKFCEDNFHVRKYVISGIKKQALDNNKPGIMKRTSMKRFTDDVKPLLDSISPLNNNLPVEWFFSSPYILKEKEINEIDSLKKTDIEILFDLYLGDSTILVDGLKKLKTPYIDYCVKTIDDFFEQYIDDRIYKIIYERDGLFSNKKKTLEELGTEYDLTRERVRQLEAKGRRIINNNCFVFLKESNYVIYSMSNNNHFVTLDKIIEQLKDDKSVYNLISIIKSNDKTYKFYPEYRIIYNSEVVSIKDIENEIVERYGDIITRKTFENALEYEKLIIHNKYNYSESKKIFSTLGFRVVDLVEKIINNYFPNGYRVYSNEDYEKFCKKYKETYGEEAYLPTDVSIRGLSDREDFCQYDRGTIISRKRAVSIDTSLMNKILDYLDEFDDVVYYASIYEKFKGALIYYGILNRYYLKGVIDPLLPKEYITKRDYISVGNEFVSSNESINNAIDDTRGIFSINWLGKKYPGVKEYVFQNILYGRDDVVNLYGGNYILINNIKMNKEFKKTLEKELDYLFQEMNYDVVSDRKIYSRMVIMHQELMDSIKEIDNRQKLLSLISVLFRNKYKVIRQFVTTQDYEDITSLSLIEEFVDEHDEFSSKTIKDYTEKMNIRGLYSFQEYMIDKSDLFVQTDVDRCVKKERLNISEQALAKIKQEINYYINSFGSINTANYSGYNRFPALTYKWNKYLLVGIIRGYLDDEYKIEYTDNASTKTEYIIERI